MNGSCLPGRCVEGASRSRPRQYRFNWSFDRLMHHFLTTNDPYTAGKTGTGGLLSTSVIYSGGGNNYSYSV